MNPDPFDAPPRFLPSGSDTFAAQPSGSWLAKLQPLVEKIELPIISILPPAHAPSWVREAGERMARPLLPRDISETDPTPAQLAKLLGWLDSVTAIVTGEVRVSPELEAKLEVALAAWWESLPVHRRPTVRDIQRNHRALCRTRSHIRRLVRRALSAAQLRPFVEAQAFHQAYAAGVASVTPEQLFDDAHYSRNQKVLFTLQFLWPVVSKFNSVGELHRELARVLGEPKVGDLKSFQKLAGDIGLRLRGRGRPRKQK